LRDHGAYGFRKGLSILGLGIRSVVRPVRPEDAPAGEAALEKIKKLQNKYIKIFDPILFPKIDLRKKIRQSMSSSGMNSALVFAVYVAVDID
jgi:hypothetical protein